jgi:hypothetical protein
LRTDIKLEKFVPNPATLKLVQANQLEQTFGPGVHWRGVAALCAECVSQQFELIWTNPVLIGRQREIHSNVV